jgi:hypothetical protein
MVFVEGEDYRTLRRPGDDPAQFRSMVRPTTVLLAELGAISQWQGASSTGTTVTDQIASRDLSFNAVSFVSDATLSAGVGYETDGVDDLGTTSFNPNTELTLSVFYTIKTTEARVTNIFGWDFNLARSNKQLRLNAAGTVTSVVGEGSSINEVTSTTTVNDGDKYRVGFGYDENNEVAVFVDGVKENSTSLGTTAQSETTFAVGGDTGGDAVNVVFDNGALYRDFGESLATDDFNAQPWA